jgi:hypothetical protein
MKQAFLTGKPSRFFLILVVLGLMFGMAWQAKAADSYDLTADFSITNGNPNDVWTYGHYTGGLDETTFVAFNNYETGVLGSLDIWRDTGTDDPNVIKNVGPLDGVLCCNIDFNIGKVTFGPYLGPAVTRFTVPSPGDWMVHATFVGVQSQNSAAQAWIHDGTGFVLVSPSVPDAPDAPADFKQLLTGLSLGDTIDIVVGFGSRTVEVSATITKVSRIDIKPGSDPNSINPKSKGVVSVAILTTETFDATTVDPLSVEFGPDGATETHGKGHIEDVDEDGDLDLVLHFKTQETGIVCGDTSASLTGETFDGDPIEESYSVKTVGCK